MGARPELVRLGRGRGGIDQLGPARRAIDQAGCVPESAMILSAQARTISPVRPPLLLIGLACIASMVVGSAGTLVVAPEPAPDTSADMDAAHTELIHRYYAGVNDALRTGDTATVTALLTSDIEMHSSQSGLPMGRDELIATLLALRAISPGTTLVVEAVHAAGDYVAVQIAVRRGISEAALGLPLDGDPAVWTSTDLFRVEGGGIEEYWGGPRNATLVREHAEFRLSVSNEENEVRLSRRRYPPAARHEHERAAGAVAVMVEYGMLTVVIETAGARPATLFRGQMAGGAVAVDPERVMTLEPGETLVLTDGARFTTSNAEHEPAGALVLTVIPWRGTGVWTPAPPGPEGVVTETVVCCHIGALPATMIARIGYATFAPGAGVPLHVAAGVEMLWVESGTLDLIADEPAWIFRGPARGAITSRAITLSREEGAVVPANASATYRAAGAEPARILIVTLQAEQSPESRP